MRNLLTSSVESLRRWVAAAPAQTGQGSECRTSAPALPTTQFLVSERDSRSGRSAPPSLWAAVRAILRHAPAEQLRTFSKVALFRGLLVGEIPQHRATSRVSGIDFAVFRPTSSTHRGRGTGGPQGGSLLAASRSPPSPFRDTQESQVTLPGLGLSRYTCDVTLADAKLPPREWHPSARSVVCDLCNTSLSIARLRNCQREVQLLCLPRPARRQNGVKLSRKRDVKWPKTYVRTKSVSWLTSCGVSSES